MKTYSITTESSRDFLKRLGEAFSAQFEKHYPNTEQGSLMYQLYIIVANRIYGGYCFLKELGSEYYAITDADIAHYGRNDRDLLISDLLASNNCLSFIGNVIRDRWIEEDKWRRISIFTD